MILTCFYSDCDFTLCLTIFYPPPFSKISPSTQKINTNWKRSHDSIGLTVCHRLLHQMPQEINRENRDSEKEKLLIRIKDLNVTTSNMQIKRVCGIRWNSCLRCHLNTKCTSRSDPKYDYSQCSLYWGNTELIRFCLHHSDSTPPPKE